MKITIKFEDLTPEQLADALKSNIGTPSDAIQTQTNPHRFSIIIEADGGAAESILLSLMCKIGRYE